MKRVIKKLFLVIITILCFIGSYENDFFIDIVLDESVDIQDVLDYQGEPYVILNNNQPSFFKDNYSTSTFIELNELDELGRVREAFACLGKETMPKEGEKRGSIGMIKPSGWQTKRYDKELVDGGYVYNRCHCIAWSLSSLNDDKRNLITGTRSFNVDGMLPFENKVLNYIKETNHHVLYKATPYYKDNELVARGIELQALSIEDNQLKFHVFIYNVQEGIEIDYLTGKTQLAND